MKTVLVILVFFFSIVALFEVYSNDRFANGEGVSIGQQNTQVGGDPCYGSNFELVGYIQKNQTWPDYCINDRGDLDQTGTQYSGSPLEMSIAITVTFVALGLLAGLAGAGALANVVSVTGIALGIFYYINSVISTQFSSLPFAITVLVNGITGVFFIYLFIKLLRG